MSALAQAAGGGINWGVVGIIVAAFLGAAGAYVGVARVQSGRIATTTADKLWDAAEKMRTEYIAQIADLRAEVSACRQEIGALDSRSDELHEVNGSLRRLVDSHEATIKTLNRKVAELERQRRALRGELDTAKATIAELERNGA